MKSDHSASKEKTALKKALFLFAFTLLFVAAAVALSFTPAYGTAAAIAVYAISLNDMAALAVYVFRSWNTVLKKAVMNNRITRRIYEDYGYRTVVCTCLTFAFNVIYAGFKLVIGIVHRSTWMIALAGYFLILSVCRLLVMRFHRNRQAEEDQTTYGYKLYGIVGRMLLLLSLAMMVIVWLTAVYGSHFYYPGYLIYLIALYTMIKIVLSGMDLIRMKNGYDPVVSSIHRINHADALMSLLALQSALMFTFGQGDQTFAYAMNAVTGTMVCASTIAMAVSMIAAAVRKDREIRIVPPTDDSDL